MEDKKSLKDKLKARLPHKKGAEKKQTGTAVSYTHLTLPTTERV